MMTVENYYYYHYHHHHAAFHQAHRENFRGGMQEENDGQFNQ